MSGLIHPDLSRKPAIDDQIDHLADEFEQSWTSESLSRLEEFLVPVPEMIRVTAWGELLSMDMELRFKNGLPVNVDDYRKIFPQKETEIEHVYNSVMASRQLGEYEFYENIGKGGMGNVYRARHRLLDRIAAIKLLHGDILEKSGSIERFLREIRLSGQLLHPNIVKTEYAGKENDRYYMVMEYIDGEDVRKIISHHGSLPLPIACEMICQAATGLQYASEQGIIHRDIKPGNLMISKEGVVKILDFGLGRFMTLNKSEQDYSLTTVGSTMGSVDYISPEQWEDAASVTIQADIYSLGCVFFFLLAGRAPFEKQNMNREQRMIAHIKGNIPSLCLFCENVPSEIENCYRKMVAKNPKDRFAQPVDIVSSLASFAIKNSLQSFVLLEGSSLQNKESSLILKQPRPLRSFGMVFTKYLPKTILMVLVGYGIYFFSSAKHHDTAQSVTKNQNDAEILNILKTNINESPVSPVLSQTTLAETLQFLGYSGRWWFEEIPWYLPFVRETVGFSCENHFFSSKINSTELISSFIPKSEGAKRLLDFLVTVGVPQAKNLPEFELIVNVYLSETMEVTSVPASVLHTHAVLLHQLTILKNSPELAQQARELYTQAIERYANETSETSYFLGNLCRFDAAQLTWWFDGDPDEFRQQVHTIILGHTDDMAFRAELLIAPAERLMAEGRNEDDTFTEAFNLIEKSTHHPMLELLHARYAAALTQQWRLAAAEPHWVKVQELATNTALSFKNDLQTARLCDGTVRARLALALSARYYGDLNLARFRYRDLIGNIQDLLTYLDTSAPERINEKSRLTRQLAEALEGLADCTLFIPSHFSKQPIPNSKYFVTETESCYTQAYELVSDRQMKFILQCKLALLRLSAGNIPIGEYKKILSDIHRDYSYFSASNTIQERTREYLSVIETLFGCDRESDSCNEIENIRNWLDNNRLNNNMVDRYAGERLDLHLFCIRLLLQAEQQNDSRLLRQDIERYLDPILLQHLASEKKMRPFLLPFYDLTIDCLKNDNLRQTVLTIRTARCQRYSGTLQKAILVFYFPLNQKNGFAVFLSLDQQKGKRFDLGFNRQEVLNAVENHQTLQLPEELVTLVKQTWLQSIRIDVSWDDSICWLPSQIKNRLTNTQWLFDSQLPSDLLWGVVR